MTESDSESSNSHDAAARFIPGSHKGWGGNDLEMEHQRESFREQKNGAAAVDITQFQNTEVGSGYQAKHVVRQKHFKQQPAFAVKDMTGGKEKKYNKRKRPEPEIPEPCDTPKTRLKKYLACAGMKHFLRELDDMLSS